MYFQRLVRLSFVLTLLVGQGCVWAQSETVPEPESETNTPQPPPLMTQVIQDNELPGVAEKTSDDNHDKAAAEPESDQQTPQKIGFGTRIKEKAIRAYHFTLDDAIENHQQKQDADLIGHPSAYYVEADISYNLSNSDNKIDGIHLGIAYKRFLFNYRSETINNETTQIKNTHTSYAFRRQINPVVGFAVGLGKFTSENNGTSASSLSLSSQVQYFPGSIIGISGESDFVFLKESIMINARVSTKLKLRYTGINLGYQLFKHHQTILSPFVSFSLAF